MLKESGCSAEPTSDGVTPVGLGTGQSIEPEGYSQALRFNGIYLARLWTCLGPITPSFFSIPPFWNENVCPVPVPALYLFAFTGSQL